MNEILFFPTMRCSLKGEYCHFHTVARKIPYDWDGYGIRHTIWREMDASAVLAALVPLAP